MDHEYFTKEKLELIMIQLILLGDVQFLNLFSNNLDEESRSTILNNLICLRMPSIYVPTKQMPDPLNVRWTSSRILIKDNIEVPSINFGLLATIEFQNMNDPETFKFKKSYSKVDNKPYDESNTIQFASAYLRYYSKKRSMSDFLLKYFSSSFSQVPFDALFRNFQFSSFYLFTDFDEVPLNLIDTNFSSYTSYHPFEDLFQAYRGYDKEYCFQKIQSMLINDISYPDSIGNDEESRICSLINTSLCKQIHFIDIIQRSSFSLFKNQKYQESIELSNMFGFESCIFIANHYKSLKSKNPTESLEETINFFRQIDYNYFSTKYNSKASLFLNRIQNDNRFLSMIRQNTGQNIGRNEFLVHSFPYLLSIFLKSNEPLPFKDLSENPLFIISDDDRMNDLDFVWSYFALSVAISALTNLDEAEELIDRSCWYISQINNPKIHHDIVVDLFSIMFLQNSSSKYICYQFVAEIILTNILDLSDDNPELLKKAQSGHMLIQFVRTITNGMNFEDLIFPKKEQLFQALEREDWMIADRIASINVELSDFNEMYKTINDFLKKSKYLELLNNNSVDSIPLFDITTSKSHSAIIEIGLSFPDQLACLEELTGSEEVTNLIQKRGNMSNKYFDLIYPIKTLDKEELIEINRNFTRLSTTEWKQFNLSDEDIDQLKLLNSFLSYLNILISTVSTEENHQVAIYDILTKDTSEFINKFYAKGSIQSAEKISKLIKQDMQLLVLTDKSVSSDSLKQIDNKTIALAAILGSESGITENPFNQDDPISYRIANLALQSNQERQSRIGQICGEKVIHKLFDESQYLKELGKIFESPNDHFDIEKVIEISYQLTEKVFSDFLFKYVDSYFYFEKLVLCIQNCASISSNLYDSVMILLKYKNEGISINSFTDLFKFMVQHQRYQDASEFLRLFGQSICYSRQIILDNYNETHRIELLSISPKDQSLLQEIKSVTHSQQSQKTTPIQYHFNTIQNMIDENNNLNLDNEIIQYIDRHLESNQLFKIFYKTIPMIKNIDNVLNHILVILENIVSKISVDSYESENFAWVTINTVYKISNVIKNMYTTKSRATNPILEEFMKKLAIIRLLVDQSPYHLIQCGYSLHNFGLHIAHALSKTDRIDALLSFYSVFRNESNVTTSTEIDSYIFNCCQFGLIDFPFPIKTNSRNASPSYSCQRSLFEKLSILLTRDHFFEPQLITAFIETFPPTESMLNCDFVSKTNSRIDLKSLKKTQSTEFSEGNQINDLVSSQSLPSLLNQGISYQAFTEDDTNEHFFRRIHVLSSHGCRPVPNQKLMKEVQHFFVSSAPADLVIEYFTYQQDFSSAMSILNSHHSTSDEKSSYLTTIDVGNTKERDELFQNSFFEKVLGRGDNIMILLKKGLNIDSDLLEVILSKSGPLLRFELYSYQEDWINTYHASIELFSQPQADELSSKARALNLLNWMDNCLNNLPDSDQKQLDLIQVALQREVCQFVITNNIACDFSSLNILQTDIQREQVVIFLFTHFTFKLGLAILRFSLLNPTKIGERLCDILMNEEKEKHFPFLTKLQRELDLMIFRQIYYALCARFAYVHDFTLDELLPYIELIKDTDFRGKMLFQFDKLEEAANLAISENNTDIAILIVNKGSDYFKPMTIAKCMKIITNKFS